MNEKVIEEAAKAHWRFYGRNDLYAHVMTDEFWARWPEKHHIEAVSVVFSRIDALGYAVVPKEPTPEMVEACSHVLRSIHQAPTSEIARLLLRAMIDAALEGK